MKSNALLAPLLLLAVGLAGCTDGTPSDEGGLDGGDLAQGMGALHGLVIDDRYRPIADAQLLLVETGTQTRSNENGEYAFYNLNPGTYTVRASIAGHEAAPVTATVSAGLLEEANVIARRIQSDDGFIISNEYAAFVPCGANVVVYGESFDCTFDQSGDSQRVKFTFDYTPYNATHFVMEMQSNQEQYWDVWLQKVDNQSCSGTYDVEGGPDTRYLRFQLDYGLPAMGSPTASCPGESSNPWMNDEPLQTYVYVNSLGFEQGVGFGLGVYVGLQANFVQNVFVGTPNVDVNTFCAYCGA